MRRKMLSKRQMLENFVCRVKELGFCSLEMGNPEYEQVSDMLLAK